MGLVAVVTSSTSDQTNWTTPGECRPGPGRRRSSAEEQAEPEPAPDGLLEGQRLPVERVADLDPEDPLADVARRPPDQKNTK